LIFSFRGEAVESIAAIVYENPIPPRRMINGFPRNLRVPFSARCRRGNRRVSLVIANTLTFMKKEKLRGAKETAEYRGTCWNGRHFPFVTLSGEFRRAPWLTTARFIYWSFYRRVSCRQPAANLISPMKRQVRRAE